MKTKPVSLLPSMSCVLCRNAKMMYWNHSKTVRYANVFKPSPLCVPCMHLLLPRSLLLAQNVARFQINAEHCRQLYQESTLRGECHYWASRRWACCFLQQSTLNSLASHNWNVCLIELNWGLSRGSIDGMVLSNIMHASCNAFSWLMVFPKC